jgi:hypothetical protein
MAVRIVRPSCMRCHILHAVSLTPRAFLIFLHTIAVLHMIFTFRCFLSMHRMHFKNFEYLREFEFIFEKALAP